MSERKLRIGMVGAGGISRVHCRGWSRLDDCELVAITDIDEAASKRRAEQFEIPDIEADPDKLVARKDIDAIDIVTPNRFHKQYTVAALKAGKHVLCEKPLALTAAEVDEMIAAAEAGGKKLMCAQHQRFGSSAMALKEYLTAHPLGEVYYARAWHNRRRLLPGSAGFIYRKNSGGGCCIDIGVHALDLALHLMGNFEPVSVTGLAVTKLAKRPDSWTEWAPVYDKRGLDVEDFAVGLVRFRSGAALSLECSFMLNAKKSESRIDLFGTEAGAKWPECEIYDHTSYDYADTTLTVRDRKVEPHHAEIQAFAEAVMGGTPVPVPPHQSRAVIAILEGLYRSSETGQTVML